MIIHHLKRFQVLEKFLKGFDLKKHHPKLPPVSVCKNNDFLTDRIMKILIVNKMIDKTWFKNHQRNRK